jgi:hypothetical protein
LTERKLLSVIFLATGQTVNRQCSTANFVGENKMVDFINFASGVVARVDLVEIILPTVTLQYSNELLIPPITEETYFYVRENFNAIVEWEATIENLENSIVVDVRNILFTRDISLKDYLAVLPEPLDENDLEDIKRRTLSVKKIRNEYLQALATNEDDNDSLTSLQEEYLQRAKRLRAFLSSSKSGESLNLLKKTPKEHPPVSSFIELEKFLATKFGVNLTIEEKNRLKLDLNNGKNGNESNAANYPDEPKREAVAKYTSRDTENGRDTTAEDNPFADIESA